MSLEKLFESKQPALKRRGVHLDLKGVPPTPTRLLELVKVFAAARYNVILVEWEDSFPWTVDERFRSPTAYTREDIRVFSAAATDAGMEIIPLVQCLGHMETPLRVPGYEHLREVEGNSSELNPSDERSGRLVMDMVDDVLALLPQVKYFHLGGDEAWHMGTHPNSRAYIEKHGKGALFMKHVDPILDHLVAKGVRPILWHDMMIEWDEPELKKLAEKSDLMTWGYRGHPDDTDHHYNTKYIKRFHELGVTLWAGTIYKGASGQNADMPELAPCAENALAWVDVARRFDYVGAVATAWSRYSTDRVQCDPIDAALDSLFNVGVILHDGKPPAGGPEACVDALGEIGEGKRFESCKDAMVQLTEIRNRGWREVQAIREELVLCRIDEKRKASRMDDQFVNGLKKTVANSEKIGEQVRETFKGLIDPVWIDEYLDTRLIPLREELDAMSREVS